jgi:hypothetical protein
MLRCRRGRTQWLRTGIVDKFLDMPENKIGGWFMFRMEHSVRNRTIYPLHIK